MDTSPLGDPKGLISGINKIYFDADARAGEILMKSAEELGLRARLGTVASGDRFIASRTEKDAIASAFSADACEMEGAAIAQVAFVNETPFAVVRAISDSADDSSNMESLLLVFEGHETGNWVYYVDNWRVGDSTKETDV